MALIGCKSLLVFNFLPFPTLKDSTWRSRRSRAAPGASRTPKVIKRGCWATTASSTVCKFNKLLVEEAHYPSLQTDVSANGHFQAVVQDVFTPSFSRLADVNPGKSVSNQRGNAIATNKLWFCCNFGETLNIFALNELTGCWRVPCWPIRFPVFCCLTGNQCGSGVDVEQHWNVSRYLIDYYKYKLWNYKQQLFSPGNWDPALVVSKNH